MSEDDRFVVIEFKTESDALEAFEYMSKFLKRHRQMYLARPGDWIPGLSLQLSKTEVG